jgi:glycosyltransferase involved in cell wall biosynthesis
MSKIEVEFRRHEICLESGGLFLFNLIFNENFIREDYELYIDLYDISNVIHPDGHIAWWSYHLNKDTPDFIRGNIYYEGSIINCCIDNLTKKSCWVNDKFIDYKALIFMVVIRSRHDDSIAEHVCIPCAKTECQLGEFRRHFDRNYNIANYNKLDNVENFLGCIRIYARDIHANDAVGNFCLEIFRLLRENNIRVQLYAENFNMWYADIVRSVSCISKDACDNDTILYFYSTYDPNLKIIKKLKSLNKFLYFHGITNPEFADKNDKLLEQECQMALNQLSMIDGFSKYATNSKYNAIQIKKALNSKKDFFIEVIPPKLVEMSHHELEKNNNIELTRLLYVGRIKSHKKIEDLLYLFSAYLILNPNSELCIVGSLDNTEYCKYVLNLQENVLKIPSSKIKWLNALTNHELQSLYLTSSIYVSMSEDEGFCLPIFEAMNFCLPVIAYDSPAVRELYGNSVILFKEKNFEELALKINELQILENYRKKIVNNGKVKANQLSQIMNGNLIWKFLSSNSF